MNLRFSNIEKEISSQKNLERESVIKVNSRQSEYTPRNKEYTPHHNEYTPRHNENTSTMKHDINKLFSEQKSFFRRLGEIDKQMKEKDSMRKSIIEHTGQISGISTSIQQLSEQLDAISPSTGPRHNPVQSPATHTTSPGRSSRHLPTLPWQTPSPLHNSSYGLYNSISADSDVGDVQTNDDILIEDTISEVTPVSETLDEVVQTTVNTQSFLGQSHRQHFPS